MVSLVYNKLILSAKLMPKCKKCEASFPNVLEIEGKNRNLSSRKFCLECSPFKQHNTVDLTNVNLTRFVSEKECPSCKITKSREEFYQRKDGRLYSYCRDCAGVQTKKRQRDLKNQAIEYKGGCCSICGYKKCSAALEFHHLNPKEKDFSLAELKMYAFNDVIKRELDKCVLLCANCHREKHSIVDVDTEQD